MTTVDAFARVQRLAGHTTPILRNLVHGFRPTPRRALVVVAAILVAGAGVAGVVLGQSRSGGIQPVVVSSIPAASAPLPTQPSGPRWMELRDLSAALGTPLLLPSYLPQGCVEVERFFFAPARAATLRYSCVLISQQVGVSGAQPRAPAEALEWVTVNGEPALYINGVWVSSSASDPGVWRPGALQQVIFQRDGRVVRVQNAGSALSKEELLHIAESLH